MTVYGLNSNSAAVTIAAPFIFEISKLAM
jgi:aminopeptidase N